jgi:hypothetical protein
MAFLLGTRLPAPDPEHVDTPENEVLDDKRDALPSSEPSAIPRERRDYEDGEARQHRARIPVGPDNIGSIIVP